MNKKSWLKYFIYTLLVIGGVYLKGFMEVAVQKDYARNEKMNYFLLTAVLLSTMAIGVVLGLEHLINEIKKEGKWKINLPKVILMVIPALYVSCIYYISAIRSEKVFNIFIIPIVKFFNSTDTFIPIFQVLLGYFIITAFYKETKTMEAIVGDGVIDNEDSDSTENSSYADDNSDIDEYVDEQGNNTADDKDNTITNDGEEKEVIAPDDSWNE